MKIKFSESEYIEIELLSRGAANYVYDCNLLRLCCVIRFRSRVALLRLIVSQYGKF